MWLMFFLLPMALAVSFCFKPLKLKYHRVPAHAGWLLVLPMLFLAAARLIPFAPPTVLLLIVTALLSYYVIRTVMCFGLLASYREYGSKHAMRIPLGATILAWVLALLEPLSIVTLLVLSYAIEYPARMDVSGMIEVWLAITSICSVGIALTFLFLGLIYSLRNQMSAYQPAGLARSPAALSDSKRKIPPPAFKSSFPAQASTKSLPGKVESKAKSKSF